MELTKQYFEDDLKELAKIKKKINNWKEKGRDVRTFENARDSIVARMSKQFRKMYESDYCLTGSDVASLLDVTDSYLFLKLKDKLDFIKPPREAFRWIDDDLRLVKNDLNEFYIVISRGILLDKEEQKDYDYLKHMKKELNALKRKKVFVSKASVVRFLKEIVDVEIENQQVVVKKSDLNAEYSAKALSKFIAEFKSTISDNCGENADKVVGYKKLSDEVVEQILSHKLRIYSAKSIKEYFVRDEYFKGDTVHDTQLYRYLDNKASYSKLVVKSTVPGLKKKAKNQSLIRYLLNVDVERKLFNKINEEVDLVVFSVAAKDYYEGIAKDFISFVNGNKKSEEVGI